MAPTSSFLRKKVGRGASVGAYPIPHKGILGRRVEDFLEDHRHDYQRGFSMDSLLLHSISLIVLSSIES